MKKIDDDVLKGCIDQKSQREKLAKQPQKRKSRKLIIIFTTLLITSFIFVGLEFFPDTAKLIFDYIFIALGCFLAFLLATALPAWHASIPARIAHNEKLTDIESPLALLTGGAVTIFIYLILSWTCSLSSKNYSEKPSFICGLSYVLIMMSIVFLATLGRKYFLHFLLFWSYYVFVFLLIIYFWENISKIRNKP